MIDRIFEVRFFDFCECEWDEAVKFEGGFEDCVDFVSQFDGVKEIVEDRQGAYRGFFVNNFDGDHCMVID